MVGSISLMLSLSYLSKFPTFKVQVLYRLLPVVQYPFHFSSPDAFWQCAEAGQKKKPIFIIKLGSA